ncbi:MAG: PorV/PorQ family protein [Candidatus Goldbacteria bacterium]|nr:PorV/PorQ family protein [Candidatus Goldiibacteriota bacterium]
MKKTYLTLLGLFICFNLYAAGEAGGVIFDMATGARPASMAGVFIAKADDVNTIFYNPAGLANIGSYEMGFTYDKNVADIRNAMITLVAPVEGIGSFGIGIIHSAIQDDINNAVEEGIIKIYDIAGILGYSYAFTKELLAGVSIKYLSSQIGDYSSSAFGFDIGILYYLGKKISLGIAGQNIGTGLKYDSEETKLPLKVGAGINYEAIKIKDHIVAISGDVKYNITESEIQGGIGIEYMYDGMFSIRAGYLIEQKSLNGFTAGGGVKSVINDMMIKFDYAFLPKIWQDGGFDPEHIVSVAVEF